MLKLIDTHVHLDQIENIDDALKQAKALGVEAVIAVGTDYNSNLKLLDIAKKKQETKVFVALGIHPQEISNEETDLTLKLIEENLKNIVAIGEIGLDYWYKEVKKDKSKKDRQIEIFKLQLQLAKKHNLPAIIHSRGAWQNCLEICQDEGIVIAIFHWYSGPLDVLEKIIQSNYFISATPSLEFSQQHKQAIKNVPLERLLLETDSPVFFGEKETGLYSEPKDVVKTLRLVSQVKDLSETEVAQVTYENAKRIFRINN